jgi:hypothetical protein
VWSEAQQQLFCEELFVPFEPTAGLLARMGRSGGADTLLQPFADAVLDARFFQSVHMPLIYNL